MDFYDSNGNTPFDLAASLNGVASPTSTIAANLPSSTNSGSTASVSASKLNNAGNRGFELGSAAWMGAVGVLAGIVGANGLKL